MLLFPSHILPQTQGSHESGDCILQKEKEWSNEIFCVCECIRHRKGVCAYKGKQSIIFIPSQKIDGQLARSRVAGSRDRERAQLAQCSVSVLR